ncbi:MAG: tRNA uridine-5-carboxymethylaminomethyl(34) synthesis enzyme MnmG [Candidatus Fimadaptatus sp.]
MEFDAGKYDVVVVGAGHAGVEAALACARLGLETLMLTLNLDSIALMPCNPAIGGTAKGHLVREIDALGGEMGRAIDDTFIQSRMLNTSKGPAVLSLRAQADKRAYQARMRRALEHQPRLTVRQGECARIDAEGGCVRAIVTVTGARYACRAAILCTGVYLKSRIIIGDATWQAGPQGLFPAGPLSGALCELGFELRRFKTGTPARVDVRTIDFDRMEPQPGDDPVTPFSFMTEGRLTNRALCYLTYTTPRTHELIRENIALAPGYSGLIRGTGARYCPSIEDKVMRFADKERHPIFLEPEGLNTFEWYVQGMSTGMPERMQWEIYHSVPGLEHAQLTRLAYAIEYDCIDPTCLRPTLEARAIPGLYFAGQINGTSGYEEAAAQGLIAGLNAAMALLGREPFLPTRAQAYMGVLVDDLTTRGVDEPYRMMTSRAEYRLVLRQDNADLRLTPEGRRMGLVDDARWERFERKSRESERLVEALSDTYIKGAEGLNDLLARHGEPPVEGSALARDVLRRPGIALRELAALVPALASDDAGALEQAEIAVKYEGYLARQQQQIDQFRRAEELLLPEDTDYMAISGLRIEARQKLQRQRPRSLGQASRMMGVSPGDVQVLMVYIEKLRRAGGAK